MIDLMCLTADKSIEAAIDGILRRPQALGIPPFTFETVVHPRRDSGCFHEAGELLGGYVERARHALVVLDHDWAERSADLPLTWRRRLEVSLKSVGPEDWARAVS
ncbi:MAG: hypothetical protein R2752_13535 [Vicinamibacterales bacterium]